MGSKLSTSFGMQKNNKKDYTEYGLPNSRSETIAQECLKVTIEHSDNSENLLQLVGDHETQVLEDGEADLHKYLVGCKKNPGHTQFIPVDSFTLKDLPEGHRDKDLQEYIKIIADLTVRVDVKTTSQNRPKFWPMTTQPYPFHNISDVITLRTGSGRIRIVNRFQEGVTQDGFITSAHSTKCWCRNCIDLGSPSIVWWEFYVDTAAHVVFDENEAIQTSLILFYNKDDSPVVSIDNINIDNVIIKYDICVLKCVTCDENVGNKLMAIWSHFLNVRDKILYKYKSTRDKYKLNFIVSHPHGCSKQISIGQWKDKHKVDNAYKFTYTTCTCPGSSGACVQCVGYYRRWWVSDLVHSGSLKSQLNYSGIGYVY